jgi:hypothetical protein
MNVCDMCVSLSDGERNLNCSGCSTEENENDGSVYEYLCQYRCFRFVLKLLACSSDVFFLDTKIVPYDEENNRL